MTGFEPATSCSQSIRATKLRYIPRTRIRFITFFRKILKKSTSGPLASDGGRFFRPNRTRTDDLLLVRQSLYQLSYGPALLVYFNPKCLKLQFYRRRRADRGSSEMEVRFVEPDTVFAGQLDRRPGAKTKRAFQDRFVSKSDRITLIRSKPFLRIKLKGTKSG
jgi:hypothetical protein